MADNRMRSKELRCGSDGKLKADWRLTETALTDTVRLTIPPDIAIPIVFVPGIMGSNLCNLDGNPVWLLNSVRDVPAGLACNWFDKGPGERQKVLHPKRTMVYRNGAVPKAASPTSLSRRDYLSRGWGEVSEASYHKFLLWLDDRLNSDRTPTNWDDFFERAADDTQVLKERLMRKLEPGMMMRMHGLPEFAEARRPVKPVMSDDLLKRSKAIYPIYAFGYNWLDCNATAADALAERINKIIAENAVGRMKCKQVILITHSMGGLVARACSQLPGMARKIVGVVHGVMPATGAAVAYRRCKVGMRDEDFKAGLVIGSDGTRVAPVFAQAPGALQLLPSKDYGPAWLKITDKSGQVVSSFPKLDPYQEIYLERTKWWGLIREEWLRPKDGKLIRWDEFARNIKLAQTFHERISGCYHHNTVVFYGGGTKAGSFETVRWKIERGTMPEGAGTGPGVDDVEGQANNAVRTDGSNKLYLGGRATVSSMDRGDASFAKITELSFWEIRCAMHDSAGDGTVPAHSGANPRQSGGRSILQQFLLDDIEHEPAYRDYEVAKVVTYYSVTKLAAMADLS